MSKYAFQFLADQVTEMLDSRWRGDVELRGNNEVDQDETCNGANWGKRFTFGEQLFQYLILKYMEDGRPSIGLLSLCQSLMRHAEKNGYRYTIWKDEKARFPEGVVSLYRSVNFEWIRYFGVAEGILQLENFNSNIRQTKDIDADDDAIKGAQVTLNLCIECAAATPSSRSRPSVFCSQKCRIANHSRKQLKSLTARAESKTEEGQVQQGLQALLLRKLQKFAEQGLNYLTVKDGIDRPNLDDLVDHNQFGVTLPRSRHSDLWAGTFDADCNNREQQIIVFDLHDKGPKTEQIRDLEEDLALLLEDSPDAYWGKSGDKKRKQLGELDPKNPLANPQVRELPTRSKKLTNDEPFLVKWRSPEEGELRLLTLAPSGYRPDPDKSVDTPMIGGDTITFADLRASALDLLELEARRKLAVDFPVIFTEPGSVEETIALMKAGTVDLSELGRKRAVMQGWMRMDPRLPNASN